MERESIRIVLAEQKNIGGIVRHPGYVLLEGVDEHQSIPADLVILNYVETVGGERKVLQSIIPHLMRDERRVIMLDQAGVHESHRFLVPHKRDNEWSQSCL